MKAGRRLKSDINARLMLYRARGLARYGKLAGITARANVGMEVAVAAWRSGAN